ncbi:MAG: ketoacyl-ACP synthase III [Ignavibacteria bacterium]|nr:ketoacyl-ACP synthase III [Ignavibacteria bacterium]
MRTSKIIGSGFYVPQQVIPNSWFNEQLGEDVDTWLRENLTIKERRWCTAEESTADLCMEAAKSALKDANITPEQLNLIIIATDTPEYISPSTASVLQYRLNAVNAGTFDMNSACSGFVTALDTAHKFIASDEQYEYILIIGAYAMSKYLNLQDKKTVTLFADGAGAVILKASSEAGYLTGSLHTEGQYADWMGIYAGGTHQPITNTVVNEKDHLLKFVKKFPKELNPEKWTGMIKNSCSKVHITPADIDHFLFTQININSIHQTLDNLEVPREKAITIMSDYGYTGSACIPMALDIARRDGRIKEGDVLCFMGSGGGLAFANVLYKM